MRWPFLKPKNKLEKEKPLADSADLRSQGRAPLSEVAKKVKLVELNTKKNSSQQLMGQYKSRFKGQGMQFSDFRVYQYGDDVRHIDWRTSAKSQQTYVKTYEEERELNIVFAVDLSASTEFGSTNISKREVLSLALASIGFSAISNNDRVGLLLFTDQVERYVPAKKGKKHVLRIIDELLTFKARHTKTNIEPTLDFLSGILRHNTVLIFASDYFAEFDQQKFKILARKHDLIALHVQDPRDTEIPAIGLIELQDLETGEAKIIDTSSNWIQSQYKQSQTQALQDLFMRLRQSGASILSFNTNTDTMLTLAKFFRARKRGKR